MQKLIVGNLKMNMENVSQRDSYCKDFLEEFRDIKTNNHVATSRKCSTKSWCHRRTDL